MKNDPGYKFAFPKTSCTYEKGRLKQIILFADYNQLSKGSDKIYVNWRERKDCNNYFPEL